MPEIYQNVNENVLINSFIQPFGLPRDGFAEAVPFSDAFGFSTTKDRDQSGHKFASVYKFYIQDKDFRSDKKLKPITIVVSYGERLGDGTIRLSPTSIPRQLNWPIDFVSVEEFYFDIETRVFYRNDKQIQAPRILEMVEVLHIKPTKIWSGIMVRLQTFVWRSVFTWVLRFIYNALIYLLYCISGTWTEKSIWLIDSKGDSPSESERVKPDSFAAQKINIFGYHASAWSVVTYSLIHLSVYTYWFFINKEYYPYVASVFANSFLVILYVIPSLVFYEKIIPKLIESLIKYTGNSFHFASFRPINLKF